MSNEPNNGTENCKNVSNKKNVFCNIIKTFTTDQVNIVLDDMFSFVSDIGPDPDIFIKRHPTSHWVMEIAKRVYQTFTAPNLEKISGISTGEQRQRVEQHSQQLISREIAEKLHAETGGIDLDFIIALSGEAYESKESDGLSIVLLPSADHSALQQKDAIKFVDSAVLPLNRQTVHAVRKQLNLAEKHVLAIAKSRDDEKFYTVGILPPKAVFQYPSFMFSKGVKWQYFVPAPQRNKAYCLLQYCRGFFMLPQLDLQPEIQGIILEKLKERKLSKATTISKRLSKIALSCRHAKGAVVIFGDDAFIMGECTRLVTKTRRGILLPSPKPLTGPKGTDTVKQLSNIDGALLVDLNGICHACGVILDGKASKGDPGRGARFNSTKSYVEFCAKEHTDSIIIGIVKSEDGMLDLFPE